MVFDAYQKRPIRFLEVHQEGDWKLKVYSISSKKERISNQQLQQAKKHLQQWLKPSGMATGDMSNQTNLFDNYQIGTLMLHEWSGGCFAIINWWVDQNMLQQYVYLAPNEDPENFRLFSDNGIVTCVWESAVIWFERNAWVKHVLMKNNQPDFDSYFNEQLNDDI